MRPGAGFAAAVYREQRTSELQAVPGRRRKMMEETERMVTKVVWATIAIQALATLVYLGIAYSAPCKNLCYGKPQVVGAQAGTSAKVKLIRSNVRPVAWFLRQQWRYKGKTRTIYRSGWVSLNVRGKRGKVVGTGKHARHGRVRRKGKVRWCGRWRAGNPRKVGRWKCRGWKKG